MHAMRRTAIHRLYDWCGIVLLILAICETTALGIPPLPPSLVARLSADQFDEREKAQGEVLQWARQDAAAAKDILYDLSRKHADPEVRRRCLVVLRALVDDDFERNGEGYVGIIMQPDIPVVVPGDARNRFGIRVSMVVANSPAGRGGLQVGDLVVGVDDQIWLHARLMAVDGTVLQPGAMEGFSKWVRDHRPGTRVTLHILRGQKVEDLKVELARRPLLENVFPPMVGGQSDLETLQQRAKDANFRQWLKDRKAGQHPK